MAENRGAKEEVVAYYVKWEDFLFKLSDLLVEARYTCKKVQSLHKYLDYQKLRCEEVNALYCNLELERIAKIPLLMFKSKKTYWDDLCQELQFVSSEVMWILKTCKDCRNGDNLIPSIDVMEKEAEYGIENLEQPATELFQEIPRGLQDNIEETQEEIMETNWIDKIQLSSELMNIPVAVYTSIFEAKIPEMTIDQRECIEEFLNLIEVKEVVHEQPLNYLECIVIEEVNEELNFNDIYEVEYARIVVDIQEFEEQNSGQQCGSENGVSDKDWTWEFEDLFAIEL